MSPLVVDITKRMSGQGPSLEIEISFRTNTPTTVIFGPSGSGKTTLLRSVAGLVRPDCGSIALGPMVFYDSNRDIFLPPFRRRLGMVFQQPSLFPHLSALDNVLFASPEPKRRDAEELLERFHVLHVAKRRPIHLSGGEQQRVVIARALAARPRLLLLDEPLPGVDGSTRASVLRDLLDYQKENEVPYLYVTHNRIEAIRLAGRVLLLERGKIVADGRTEEVLTAPACVEAVHVLGIDNVLSGTLTTHHQEEGLSEIDLGGVSLFSAYTPMPLDSPVAVTIPSTEIVLSMDRVSRTSAQNVLSGIVSRIFEMNGSFEIMVETPVPFRAHISRSSLDTLGLRPGAPIHLLMKAIAIVVEPL